MVTFAYAAGSLRSLNVGEEIREEVRDEDEHHCNFAMVPNLLLEDLFAGRVRGSSVQLWLFYKQLVAQHHGRPPTLTLRDIGEQSGLGQGTILQGHRELETLKWLGVSKEGVTKGQVRTVTIRNRWAENCRHDDRIAQKLSKSKRIARNPANEPQNLSNRPQNLSNSDSALHPVPVKDSPEDEKEDGIFENDEDPVRLENGGLWCQRCEQRGERGRFMDLRAFNEHKPACRRAHERAHLTAS
jgi:hypothetical protein